MRLKTILKMFWQKSNIPMKTTRCQMIDILIQDLLLSSSKMKERLKRIKLTPDMDVFIKVEDKSFNVLSAKDPKGKIECSLDLRLLKENIRQKKSLE